MIQVQALITKIEVLASGYYHFTMEAPGIADLAKPGQFIQISVAGVSSNDPILPRPISLFRVHQTSGMIEIIFKTFGRGTNILAGKKTGEYLSVLGPIGNGFSIPDSAENIALIAGGIGMPPLFFLAEYLNSRSPDKFTLFYGGRTKNDLLALGLWQEINTAMFLATEDGSLGFEGRVTDLFLEQHSGKKFDFIASCGPTPMLKAVRKIAIDHNIPGEISLEAHMACGVGACLGCVCKTLTGYQRVCVDGPVFSMNEVTFND